MYAKGKKDLTDSDVIAAGRKAGLKDVKVMGFSSTHTVLKFIVPLEARQRALNALQQAAMNETERRYDQYPYQLSGGLRQRAMIAMASSA